MITQRKLPEPATVTGNISIQNSHGCDKIIMKKISHKISKGTALYLLSFVLLSSTEKIEMYFLLQKESHRQWWPVHLHRFTAQKRIKRRCSFFYLLALCANSDSPVAWSSQITEIMWSLRRGCIRSKKHSFSVGEIFRGLGKGGTAKKKKKKNQHQCKNLPMARGSFASCTEKFSRAVISCHPVSHSSAAATAIYSTFTLEHLLKPCIRRTNQTVLQQLGRWVFSVPSCAILRLLSF